MMYFKEEIQITEDDRVIIDRLAELLSLSAIDNYFYLHDQEFFVQMGLFTNSEFEEAYDKGFAKYFIHHKHFYKWVTNNTVYKFTALLEAWFKGLLLEQFNEDADGVLTYKNCKAYRTYHIVTQSEEQAETTQEVNNRILELEEVHAYENGMLEIEDNLIQTLECFHIKVQSADKVYTKKKKELIKEIRTLIYQKMCSLLTKNFQRANCVEEIQYRLILGMLLCTIDKGFTPRFRSENYERFEVAKNVTVSLESEFKYFKSLYADFRHYKKNLIRL